MAFHIACPSCQGTWAVHEHDRGTIVTCGQCGKKMRVPGQAQRTQAFQQEPPSLPQAYSRQEPEEDSLEGKPLLARSRRKRPRYEEDEDDYRPAPRRKRDSRLGLWLGIGGGVVTLAAIAVVVVIVILKQSRPAEPGRHVERAGRFSYVPIPGWQIRDFPGLQFKVVVALPEQGFAPNLNFVPENSPLAIADYTDANIATLKAMFPNLRFLGKQPFVTDQGLQGFKIIQENQQGNLMLRQCQYMFGNGPQKIVITGTVPVNAGPRYDALMDACAKSFRFE